MRTVSALLLVCLVLGLAAGCKEPGKTVEAVEVKPPAELPKPPEVVKPAPVPPKPALLEETTLEVETFKLDEAEVKDLAGASGGKAVLFASETAGAETVVPLKKGTYEVTLYAQGSDEDHDAVYLSVAGIENRVYTPEWGKVVACEPVVVVVPKDGPCKVVLLAAETGVYLDKVVLKRVK